MRRTVASAAIVAAIVQTSLAVVSAAKPPSPSDQTNLVCSASSANANYPQESTAQWRITSRSIPDAQTWSGHHVPQDILVAGEATFIGYYDADQRLALAYRPNPGAQWATYRVPGSAAKVGWDSHNGIELGLDSKGRLHVAANMHLDELRYWRMTRSGDLSSLRRVETMVSSAREQQVTYPQFLNTASGELIFRYRNGGSGDGQDYLNVYRPESGTWESLLSTPLFDGSGEDENYNAYYNLSEEPNADGYYEVTWMWRRTPDASTNSRLSYMRSKDLRNWETASGKPISLPVTYGTDGVVVDDVAEQGGLLNGTERLTTDESGRPLVVYYKYAADGSHQLFASRFRAGEWKQKRLTNWRGAADFSGIGTIQVPISLGTIDRLESGDLRVDFRCSGAEPRARSLVLDGRTLRTMAETAIPSNGLPAEVTRILETKPKTAYGVLNTEERNDRAMTAFFWQSQGVNGDQPFRTTPRPLPIRVYDLEPVSASAPVRHLRTHLEQEGYRLTWSKPADSGGRPVQHYLIEVSNDGGLTWQETARPAKPGALIPYESGTDVQELTFRVTPVTQYSPGASLTTIAPPIGEAVQSTPWRTIVFLCIITLPLIATRLLLRKRRRTE
ncbi:BNR repeat-containing protein [Zhihengliuella flava]|uniref:Fibronectin type-III domain-containing protein n=1 Tax=Zhihengliuella flava TaxID=1285193 RepID=A0A931GE07_9MICC|nr:BNR repeat-containing protein [Zhihengliuella flava]MBG6083540.1 hypothetical protein [Zhihengliuella flava]